MLSLDHIAVAATSLAEGRAYVAETLGLQMGPGGEHGRFGTHNLLIGLQDGLYLEVIAVDPDAPPPDDARWFDLDGFAGAPRLHNWICRCDDLAACLPVLPAGAGRVTDLRRDDLRWQMAVPETGRLPYDEICPAVLQWQGNGPAARLPQSGARLDRLVLTHPRIEALRAQIEPLLADPRIAYQQGDQPGLRAEFTVDGERRVL